MLGEQATGTINEKRNAGKKQNWECEIHKEKILAKTHNDTGSLP
jgi:hypothetical protein